MDAEAGAGIQASSAALAPRGARRNGTSETASQTARGCHRPGLTLTCAIRRLMAAECEAQSSKAFRPQPQSE
jgi:hypothetical protein